MPLTKPTIIAACFLLSASFLHAQFVHGLNQANNGQADYTDRFEEKTDLAINKKIPSRVLKSLPAMLTRDLEYFSEPLGRKKARLTAEESGRFVFSTHYRRNQLHGVWISKYTNGGIQDSGSFSNNMPDGVWKSWYDDGTLRSIRTYNANKYYAVSNEIKRKNEKVFYHSLSRMGILHPANYEHVTSARYSFISLHTEHAYIPPFVNCLHDGLYMNFYPNGIIKDSGYYKDGLRDGIWNEYHENGELKSSGYYYKGQKNSGWKYYTDHGRLLMLSEYKYGKLVHRKRY